MQRRLVSKDYIQIDFFKNMNVNKMIIHSLSLGCSQYWRVVFIQSHYSYRFVVGFYEICRRPSQDTAKVPLSEQRRSAVIANQTPPLIAPEEKILF